MCMTKCMCRVNSKDIAFKSKIIHFSSWLRIILSLVTAISHSSVGSLKKTSVSNSSCVLILLCLAFKMFEHLLYFLLRECKSRSFLSHSPWIYSLVYGPYLDLNLFAVILMLLWSFYDFLWCSYLRLGHVPVQRVQRFDIICITLQIDCVITRFCTGIFTFVIFQNTPNASFKEYEMTKPVVWKCCIVAIWIWWSSILSVF